MLDAILDGAMMLDAILDHSLASKLLVNTPIIGDLLLLNSVEKIRNLTKKPPNIEKKKLHDVQNLNHRIKHAHKLLMNSSDKIQFLACAAITLFVVTCFGLIPGAAAGAFCVTWLLGRGLLEIVLANRAVTLREQVNTYLDACEKP